MKMGDVPCEANSKVGAFDGIGAAHGERLRSAKPSGRRQVLLWFAVVLTVVCLALLVQNARLPSLAAALASARFDFVALALLLSLLTLPAKAARWRGLYIGASRPTFTTALVGIAAGIVANWAIPVRAGEALRLGLATSANAPIGDLRHGAGQGIGVLVVEKVLDAGALVLSVAGLVVLGNLPSWLNWLGLLASAGGILGFAGFVVVLRTGALTKVLYWLLRFWRLGGPDSVLAGAGTVGVGLTGWLTGGSAVRAAGWTLASWVLGAVTNALVAEGLGLHVGLSGALAVLIVLYGGAILPSLPGRLGVFQYTCVAALLPFGVSFDMALAYSFVLYAIVYLPPLLVGLLAGPVVAGASAFGREGRSDV